jgi:hypothetical protein
VALTIQGLLIIVLGLVIDNAEVVNALATDIIMIAGILISWWGRYRLGGVKISGFRK